MTVPVTLIDTEVRNKYLSDTDADGVIGLLYASKNKFADTESFTASSQLNKVNKR